MHTQEEYLVYRSIYYDIYAELLLSILLLYITRIRVLGVGCPHEANDGPHDARSPAPYTYTEYIAGHGATTNLARYDIYDDTVATRGTARTHTHHSSSTQNNRPTIDTTTVKNNQMKKKTSSERRG